MKKRDNLRLSHFLAKNATLVILVVLLSCGPSAQKLESVSNQVGAEVPGQADPLKNASDATKAASDTIVTVAGADGSAPAQEGSSGSLTPGGGVVQIEKSTVSGSTLQTYQGNVDSSLVSIQVKSLDLLEASIESCFGNNSSTLLTTDMFALSDADFPSLEDKREFDAEGKKQFLNQFSSYNKLTNAKVNVSNDNDPTNVSIQDDVTVTFKGEAPRVTEVEAENLNDASSSVRMGVSVDTLSDRYLRALEMVGQVVAHNCNLKIGGLCDCTTVEKAAAMLLRCLPSVSFTDKNLNDAADSMAGQCSVSKFEQRKAIASLVASYAFAVRR